MEKAKTKAIKREEKLKIESAFQKCLYTWGMLVLRYVKTKDMFQAALGMRLHLSAFARGSIS